MTMSPETARNIERPPIIVGNQYTFFAEMQQEYEPAEKRMRRFTGTLVTVLRVNEDTDWFEPFEENGELVEPEVSKSFFVRAKDGSEFCVHEEEINDWDRDLGQYFWPDATYGPDHDTLFLGNEERVNG